MSPTFIETLPLRPQPRLLVVDDDVDSDDKAGAPVAAIVTLAQRLGIQTVAAGVESPAQAAALQGLGCFLHQRYLCARPMPVDAFEALLATSPDQRRVVLD